MNQCGETGRVEVHRRLIQFGDLKHCRRCGVKMRVDTRARQCAVVGCDGRLWRVDDVDNVPGFHLSRLPPTSLALTILDAALHAKDPLLARLWGVWAQPALPLLDLRAEPPWDDLDPGIRSVVRMLWEAGFAPTDSGDGVSKRGSGMEGVLPMPHVVVQVDDPGEFITTTDAVTAQLADAGFDMDPRFGWHVEGTYSQGSALVIAYGPEPTIEDIDREMTIAGMADGPSRTEVAARYLGVPLAALERLFEQ